MTLTTADDVPQQLLGICKPSSCCRFWEGDAMPMAFLQVFASYKEQEEQRSELMKTAEKHRRVYERKLREVSARHQKTDAAILQTSEENAGLKQQVRVLVSSGLRKGPELDAPYHDQQVHQDNTSGTFT